MDSTGGDGGSYSGAEGASISGGEGASTHLSESYTYHSADFSHYVIENPQSLLEYSFKSNCYPSLDILPNFNLTLNLQNYEYKYRKKTSSSMEILESFLLSQQNNKNS